MSDQANRIREIFLQALETGSADERNSYLQNACADDVARRRVEALLVAHERPESLLDKAALALYVDPADTAILPPIAERAGEQIGPYKLVDQIGEGGFGVVYLAEQQEPVRRQVALKIIKPGMDTREVIARFEAERQALALMDHPGIARVLDAGATESGRPYFVMELVRGIPITDYCDQCNLTTEDRLRLFIEVCHGIQHAHQKGVIHRDVKPTNVMVAMQDGQPAVKVIDFGVAKAINQRLTEHTLMTGMSQLIGTPLYMSPEQAEMGSLDIDTRSDIYSLGVLLYELLTGTTPFERERLKDANYDELRRIIREEEPPRPSTRLSTLAAQAISTVAEHRRTDARKLRQLIRGDLDWIVMKALDKDRTRRYETASALARDVERYLNEEPVEACPPSAAYRFRKFARRNRGRLVALTSVVLIILVGWGISTVLIARERNAAQIAAVEAEKERKRAEENLLKAKQAVDTWFTQVAGDLSGQPHMTNIQRALLEQALEFYKGFLKQKANDPVIRREAAKAYKRVAFIYGALGRHQESADTAQGAVVISKALAKEHPDDTGLQDELADSYRVLGVRRSFAGEKEIAAESTIKAIDIWERLALRHPSVPAYQRQLAKAHVNMTNQLAAIPGRLAEAEAHGRESLAGWERFRNRFPDLPMQTEEEAHSHLWLAAVLIKARHYAEGEEHLRRCIKLRTRLVAENPENFERRHKLAHAKIYLGVELLRKGAFAKSERELRSAVDLLQRLVDDYPDIREFRDHLLWSYNEWSLALFSQKRYEEAEQAAREKLALLPAEEDADFDHLCNIGWTYYGLGLLIHRRGDIQEAADLFRKAIELFERVAAQSPASGAVHRRAQNALHWALATCPLPQFQDPQRALTIAKWLAQREPLFGDRWAGMGLAHFRLGNFDQAVAAIEKEIELNEQGSSLSYYVLAMAHWQRGNKEQARIWYQRANDQKENPGGASPDLVNFRDEAEKLMGIAIE